MRKKTFTRIRAVLQNTICVLLFCCFFTLPGYALEVPPEPVRKEQNTTFRLVTGTVTSVNGEPLAGASVQEKGTTNGVVTDFDGDFTIEVSDNAVLVVSYIGFKALEVPVDGREEINVSLQEDLAQLDEVVVVGYGTQRKQDLTGAVSVVKTDEMLQQPTAQVTNQLQGRVSGVTITGSGQPGEAPQIKIRGANTFGNNSPLFVVDGIPTDNINDLNPNDIESMQVLKDAGSASIYGSRAANGVIIITTKKGKGRVKVTYDGYYGMQIVQRGNPWNILSPQEMADLKWAALRNTNPGTAIDDPQYGNGASPILPNYISPAGGETVDESRYFVNPFYTDSGELADFYRIVKANKKGTNWFQEIFRPANIQSHNVSVSSGNENGNYLFSMNYFNQEGTLRETYLKRYTIRVNSSYNISDHIRVGENIAFSITDNPQISALTEGSAIGMAFRQQPIIPVRDIMGNFAGSAGNDLGNAKNPVAIQERTRNNRGVAARLFGSIFAEIDFLDHFTLRTSYGGQYYSNSYNSFAFPEYENQENNTINEYTEGSITNYNWTWTNTLTYKNTFNDKHNLTVLVGTEAYQNRERGVEATAQGFSSFDPDYVSFERAFGTRNNSNFRQKDALFSLLGRLDYNFDDRYLLSATIRRDGSSRFLNNQYGWFPAVSGGWNISNEDFIQMPKWISELKIRGGYGVMGNQLNVPTSNSYTTIAPSRLSSYYPITGNNQTIVEGFQQMQIGEPDAKWERNSNTNIGVDMNLFGGKVQLTADYYSKTVDQLLFNPELLGTAGRAEPPFVNVGKMTNKGLDIDMSTHFNLTEDLRLNTTVTFTTYDNKIEQIADGYPFFDEDSRRFPGNSIVRNQAGRSISEFFGYKIVGFWNSEEEIETANTAAQSADNPGSTYQNDMAIGRFRYADVNGDGRITESDRTFLGNPNPDFTYGVNVELLYKNWDFSIFLYGSQGNDIWNNVRWWTDFYSSFQGAKSHTALYNSWTPQNMNAKAPIQETTSSFSTNSVPNSYYVEDGSYLRARQIQLGYTLPSEALERYGITRLRLYVQAVNPFTITSYSGLDPEIAGDATSFGIDEGAYPNQKQFLFGINLTL